MVRITRVHTGGGDAGETSLLSGARVAKDHPRLALYGTIDELNSLLGVIRAEVARIPDTHRDGGTRATVVKVQAHVERLLSHLQQELFDVGGECACPPADLPEMMAVISMEAADRLVAEMDVWTDELPALSSFILPAGNPAVAQIHVARCVARRAERAAIAVRTAEGDDAVRDVVLAYLNRLSDWLFVLARWITLTLGEDEVLWVPLGKRD